MVIHLPEEIELRLGKLARRTGRTEAFHAREAILTYFKELEDLHWAKQRLATPARRWSHEDLEADVDPVRLGARHTAETRPPTA